MIRPPRLLGGEVVRAAALVVGLFVFSTGIAFQVESGLGLGPWDVLNQGLEERTPLSFGAANVVVALCVLALAWALGARIGSGTVANAILIGLFVDRVLALGAVKTLSDAPLGVRGTMLAGGILLVGLGTALYIGAAYGAGPRDSLMLVGASRTGLRIGLVRASLEVAVAVLGFALGGTVGLGTVAFALGIGPVVELWFTALVRLGLARPDAPEVSTIAPR